MPATYVLATEDPDLLRAWWVLVPPGRQVLTLEELAPPAVLPPGIPTVVILDASSLERLPLALRMCPTIAVGEPGSSALDRARNLGPAKVVLSYDESRTRLGALLPLIEELAERGAALDVATDRTKRVQPVAAVQTAISKPRSSGADPWEFVEGLVERLGSRARLLDEFRRIVRVVLNTSSVLFFLRDGGGYRADRGEASCPADDPLCQLWASHPMILDGLEWPVAVDAITEISVRQRMRQWASRLLIPLHDNGRIQGFVALGVRDDGESYDEADRARAISLARLLRQSLEQSSRMGKLTEENDRWKLAEHYLPNVMVLGTDEPTPKQVPSPVRALIVEVRQSREAKRLSPSVDQPFRASAGLVSEDLGVWVYWEDASADVRETTQRQRAARLALLHDIALTLNHELGNALVSLATLRHNPGAETNSPVLLAAIKRDIASLESINRHLASIPTFSEVTPEETDLRSLVREVGRRTGVMVDGNAPELVLSMVPKLVDFALESIIESIAENRPELGKRELTLRLRTVSEGDRVAGHVSIKGPKLALEGIWPTPEPGDAPSHGRISVFVAKEIIRLHGGDIRATQTTIGTEITILIGNW